MITLLVVVAVVLLVMWLTQRRRNYELSGNRKGLALSNAVYGGKLTEYGYLQNHKLVNLTRCTPKHQK